MAKRPAKKKPQPDHQQIARKVLDAITAEADSADNKPAKNPAAVALGRLGGLKGGHARSKALTKKQRSEIAKNAANARWSDRESN